MAARNAKPPFTDTSPYLPAPAPASALSHSFIRSPEISQGPKTDIPALAADLLNDAPGLASWVFSPVMIPPDSVESPPVSSAGPTLAPDDGAIPEDFDVQSRASSRDPGSVQTAGDTGLAQDGAHDPQRDDSRDDLTQNPNENGAGGKPPWSEMKTKAGKERKRLPLACIACRRKKIRCSGEKPACKHCSRSRIPCVYKVTTRKAAPRTDYMAMLDKRLKRMEDRVIKTIPKDETRDMAAIGRSVVRPPQPGQALKAQKKRSAEEAFAAEMDEWARGDRRAPQDTFPMRGEGKASDVTGLLTEGAEFLPSLEIQEHLAEVFFDCVYGQSYLLLHKPSFMRRLKARTVPPVLILAVCAVSARFSTHPQINSDPPFLRGENWANPAAAIALSRHDEPSITILTVFLLLGLHEFGTCHGGRSWSFGGQALRMAYALQLHRELDYDPLMNQSTGNGAQLSFTDREIRRRTMWACVLMDRYNSSGSQRPPIGNEKFLQIQLPIKESSFQLEIPGPTEDLDGNIPNPVPEDVGQLSNAKDNMGVSAYIIRAVMIWGRIVDYLNLGGKRKDEHPLWSSESGYMKLKRQIEEFSATLPNHLAFTFENLQIHAADKIANQFLFLHIIIHQNMLFLNQFAIPLSPGGRPPKDMPKSFLSNAGRAAVEAAHHISVLIDRASAYPLTVPFAGYCAYSASTVHIWGIFSKNAQLEARSKENLRHTYRYLNKMKKYWGMFHYMVESAKDRYRQFADAAIKGSVATQNGGQITPMFQYGDWFDKYPHGVSRLHWEDADSRQKDRADEAVMGQKPDLQSVEDFFASLSPSTPQYSTPRRSHVRKGSKAVAGPEQPTPTPPVIDMSMNDAPGMLGTSGTGFPHPTMYDQQSRAAPFGQTGFEFGVPEDQLPQLDRQFVYGSFSGFDPSSASLVPADTPGISTSSGADPQSTQDTSAIFAGQIDPNVPSGAGEYYQPSAWFLPFNLDPVGAASLDSSVPAPGSSSGNGAADMASFNGTGSIPLGAYDLGMGMDQGTHP
ncbi:putative C6 transcription factor [Aspergillus clavatus NRRL 1]|uniref:C6 transcription factor, putative n=1 Tax=Aspergillus clavatus (strain ATCC 1007 / CBS 513.65 / DSM 816 / NCTC 3887 / NRRL 1 / QM 1276 / 107) TaxID=344612 RepID=A1CR89_ASPCL|nr:C6 transcription factor, putative [Aspergillus clavatus NRRL 1]EAW08160.1 C6 transcription factor, putative [Aspergillus clavatus NRRL 1]